MNHPYLTFIESVLETTSEVAVKQFGHVSSMVKTADNNQVLTATDLEIGKHIVSAIQDQFPGHNVIDEEAGAIDNNSDYTWVVDPINGTSNFASGVPTYGIMVGLLKNDQPIAGGIALPSFNEIYLGGHGYPATRNGQPIMVSIETNLLNCLVGYGIDGHQEDPSLTRAETAMLAKIILGIRNLRTSNSAFDVGLVARGAYAADLNQTSKIWDNVGPHAVIEAAGGIYTAFDGETMNYHDAINRLDDNFTFCRGSKTAHLALQKIIHD